MTHFINIAYVLFWGVVSFIATFMCVLDGDWSKVLAGDLLKDIFCPVFIWVVAFFGDYLYNILSMNKRTHMLDECWTKTTYFVIEFIFVILVVSAYWESTCGRTITLILLYICMMGLKAASLYAVCPRQKVVPL